MEKNQLVRWNDSIWRVLVVTDQKVYAINCGARNMPRWVITSELTNCELVTEEEMHAQCGLNWLPENALSTTQLRQAHDRYRMISGILPFLGDDHLRNDAIRQIAEAEQVSRRTLTTYLVAYLIAQDLSVLVPMERKKPKIELTHDQKNMRWALRKFYYTRHGNTLTDTYIMMLKERYTNDQGELLPEYPSLSQMRYFFRKTRKKQTELISRKGIKEYQLNHRPLLGDGVQTFAPAVGTAMLDATICDIYLVDDAGKLVGRPILVACVDAFSGLCMGYSLLWEGGVYSVRELLMQVIADKVEWCRRFGITIERTQWSCRELPGRMITDRGSEYISMNFEQVTELGCEVISLPSFSANMKGPVEKLFDLVQDSFKPYLKGKGVVEPDIGKRGVRDYRKDACLTMEQFEKIVIHCILYHNNSRVLENYPYTQEMLEQHIAPHPCSLWEYGRRLPGANLIEVDRRTLALTLLPRTQGRFARKGLLVNHMRYHADGYAEQYLTGGSTTVAYNPDDVTTVYLISDEYHEFQLIEGRFAGKSLEETSSLRQRQRLYISEYQEDNVRARVELAQHIETIAGQADPSRDTKRRGIRSHRQTERRERHRDQLKEG